MIDIFIFFYFDNIISYNEDLNIFKNKTYIARDSAMYLKGIFVSSSKVQCSSLTFMIDGTNIRR